MLTIYGCKGCGSVVIEAACELLGETYERREVEPWTPGPALDALRALNPLAQVPTVVLPDGTVLTESAAILLWLLERHPQTHLAPPPGDPKRPAFLRWLVYFVSSIYPMYTVGDFPARWVKDEGAQKELKAATVQRTLDCWRVIEQGISPGTYLLGETMTILDVYAAMISRWRPGREKIREVAPRCIAAAERTEAHPIVARVFTQFPAATS